jgi:hypothetical protein
MSALDLVMAGARAAANPAGTLASAVGSTPQALGAAIPTGFNQGLVGLAGTAYNALVNAPKMVAGVGAVMMGRPDLAPDVREGTGLITSALKDAGLGSMIAAPPAGDTAANLLHGTAALAPGLLIPDVELSGLGDAALSAFAKAPSLGACSTCALKPVMDEAASDAPEWVPATAGFTFRGSNTPPDVVFQRGFLPRGESTDILAHAKNNVVPPSAFISTSSSADSASAFGSNVYAIRPVNGIDVNATLGDMSPYPTEREVAVPGPIDPSDIRGVTFPYPEPTPDNPEGNPYSVPNSSWKP